MPVPVGIVRAFLTIVGSGLIASECIPSVATFALVVVVEEDRSSFLVDGRGRFELTGCLSPDSFRTFGVGCRDGSPCLKKQLIRLQSISGQRAEKRPNGLNIKRCDGEVRGWVDGQEETLTSDGPPG